MFSNYWFSPVFGKFDSSQTSYVVNQQFNQAFNQQLPKPIETPEIIEIDRSLSTTPVEIIIIDKIDDNTVFKLNSEPNSPSMLQNSDSDSDSESISVFYPKDLLNEIRQGIKLKRVEPKESNKFLNYLQYNLEVLIVNERISRCGKDSGSFYTDQEYKNAFNKIIKNERDYRYRRTYMVGFGIFVLSLFGSIINNHNYFWNGVYISNIIFGGTFLFNSV